MQQRRRGGVPRATATTTSSSKGHVSDGRDRAIELKLSARVGTFTCDLAQYEALSVASSIRLPYMLRSLTLYYSLQLQGYKLD